MIRTFHPVGHGAFYTERFNDNGGKCVFTAVYDCGSKQTKHIKGAIEEAFAYKDAVDLLFISHLHSDHINGVKKMMEQCNVKRIVLPALKDEEVIEALLYNYIETTEFDNDANKFIADLLIGDFGATTIVQVESYGMGSNVSIRVVDLDSIDGKLASGTEIVIKRLNWRYYPINLSLNNSESIIKALSKVANIPTSGIYSNGRLDYKILKKIVEDIGISECAKIYKEVFGYNHNRYSMSLVSMATVCLSSKCKRWCRKPGNTPTRCTTNCLYTGDFEATKEFDALTEIFEKFDIDYAKIGVLQVPHHGSKHNMNIDMYKSGKICVISANSEDKKHPDMLVIQHVQQNNSIPVVVSEKGSSIQRFLIPLCL